MHAALHSCAPGQLQLKQRLPPPPPLAAAAGGDNVWAGWVPAAAGEGEATAAGMKEKLRAKQAGEGGSSEAKEEEKAKAEDLVTREKTIGSGALLAGLAAGWLGCLFC